MERIFAEQRDTLKQNHIQNALHRRIRKLFSIITISILLSMIATQSSQMKIQDINEAIPTKSNEIRCSKKNQQFIFFPLQEKNQIYIHVEEKPAVERLVSRITSTNENRINNLSELKEYKVLKARKQAKKMSEAFQIKSINLIKKFRIQKQTKIPREIPERSPTIKYRKNEMKNYIKIEKSTKGIQDKKQKEGLCITTTSFTGKRNFGSSHKEEYAKDKFDFKLQLLLRSLLETCKSHGIQLKKIDWWEKKQPMRAFVGKGNNAILIKELIKKRWWWAIGEDKSESKLIWSQVKDKSFFFSPTTETIHNHFFHNEELGSKKQLYFNMKKYYEKNNKNPFEYLPLTFHVNGQESDGWKDFVSETSRRSEENSRAWIIKPGQNSNRGNGIKIFDRVEEIQSWIVKSLNQRKDKDKISTFIIQEYIDRPFLYNKRKFDLRCFILIVKMGKNVKGYWCREGYIRTSSYEFRNGELGNSYIHLTNDAIQHNSEDYGKFEEGNKLSFGTFQKYLDSKFSFKYSFQRQIYPLLKDMAEDIINASLESLGSDHPASVFQLFGLDFMIDHTFKPWLIEVNTNPCLQTCSNLQRKLLPRILDDVFKLTIDPLFPPPENWPNSKKHLVPSISNCFQLIYAQQRTTHKSKNSMGY